MDHGETIPDEEVQRCLIAKDRLTDGSGDQTVDDETGSVRLTIEENEEMREFLDSASRLTANKFDLRDGFYTDCQPAASWHCLSEDEVTAHHRMGVFPHTWHPLSSLDPSHERHLNSRRSSSKQIDLSGVPSPTNHFSDRSELCGVALGNETGYLDKSNSCNVVLGDTSPSSNLPWMQDVYADDAVSQNEVRIWDRETDGVQNVDWRKQLLGANSPSIRVFDSNGLPSCVARDRSPEAADSFLKKSDDEDVSSPLIAQSGLGFETGTRETSMPKVSFFLGADPDEAELPEPPKVTRLSDRSGLYSSRPPKSKKPHGHSRRHHLHGPVLELSHRRRLGSEVCFGDSPSKHTQSDMDEASLEGVHLEEITSHRFDDSKGIRRRKISHHAGLSSVVHLRSGQVKKVRTAPVLQKRPPSEHLFHQPHKMFVELDELRVSDNQEWAWCEKARWIKFEEEVEEDAQRWGKPHVSSLSFHSLLDLRRCIESAAILLDLEATDVPTIATHIVEHLINIDQLRPELQGNVLKALLLKHRETGSDIASPDGLSKVTSSPAGMTLLDQLTSEKLSDKDLGEKQGVKFKDTIADSKIKANSSVRSFLSTLSPKTVESPSFTNIRHADSHILRRIPEGAEATNVLVGNVDFLDRPIMAFVRLRSACHLENLTEVPLPVRFIFVLMGPEAANLDYHEIGRSLATLMADEAFHDTAYVAENRQDLLDALNAFLHDSVVLPPGEWDKKTLLPITSKSRQQVAKKRAKQKDPAAAADKQEKQDDPLQRTGRMFGGLINDVKRRYPLYLSDILDGLNIQCIATFFFVYFACLSPAITFGGLLGDKTDKWMGVSEMLVSTAICGIVFSLLSGQPLIIIGATGPVLIFEEALFKICDTFSIEFLPFRLWVGLWIAVIASVVVMLEGSFLVQYITRFTEEIFASLISLIFIYEVFKKLVLVFQKNPLKLYYPPRFTHHCQNVTDPTAALNDSELTGNDSNSQNGSSLLQLLLTVDNCTEIEDMTCDEMGKVGYPNTAFLSLILTLGTFLMAQFLKNFRNSQFLGRSARRALGDFGVPITIIIVVLVDYLIPNTCIEKLDVPDGIKPTAPLMRGWFVNPLGMATYLPAWAMFATIIPALLVFILLFMEAQITSMIVNKKDRKLKKGSGYHVDLLLIGVLASVCGFLGLPFMCSATVRSVTHVSALSVFSRTHAPGEKPRLIEVKEQRLTAFAIHVMIGVSVLMGPVLRQVPLPVLFGIFLYMGISSMSGIQMLHRVQLMFMPVKHHPDVGYARRVRLAKMNLYTGIQLACLGVLWAVKSTQIALAFPFVLILMVPVRLHVLRFLFTPQELGELDKGEEESSDNEEGEPDFYAQAHMPI